VATDAVQHRPALRESVNVSGLLAGTALLAALMGISLYLRTRALDGPYWIDEGLSVGISSFPLSEIPGVLRQDGSPPLYYALLHVWMDAFGSSERATHALSILFALLAVPAALWAGWSLFGRRAGWLAATLAALNPFLTIYAQETRMYSLVILLSILATAAFLHAFAFRRRGYVPVFAALLIVMLYTHNWALFFAAGTLAALAFAARERDDRRDLLGDAAIAYGAAAVAYLPWLPTLVSQTLHTGAPWSNTPSPVELFGGFLVVLNGQGAVVALILAGGVGMGALLRRLPVSAERTAVLALLWITVGTILTAWLASQITPAWANRYLGVLVGPVLLLAAAVVPRAGRLGIAAVVLVAIFWLPYSQGTEKSNARTLGALYASSVGPDDVVLSTHPEQVPVLAHYFGRDIRYATPLGPFPDSRVMDWRGVLGRLERATPATTLEPILDGMAAGSRVFLIRPLVRDDRAWSAPWTRLVRRRSEQWELALAADGRFRRTEEYVPPYTDRIHRPLVLEIFEKTAAG
jgi:hypothetical protein